MSSKLLLLISLILFFGLALNTHAQTAPPIDLLWSADTYRPAGYLGHSVATPGVTVKVAALVGPTTVNLKNFNFNWWKDGQYLNQSSGPGKTLLSFTTGHTGEQHQITLKLEAGGSTIAEKTVAITVVAPSLVIYQNDPLFGPNYGAAVGENLPLVGPEVVLLAEPYDFPTLDVINQKINFLWQLNGQKVAADPADGRQATFAAPSGAAGENRISVSAESTERLFQQASRAFQISFGGNGGPDSVFN